VCLGTGAQVGWLPLDPRSGTAVGTPRPPALGKLSGQRAEPRRGNEATELARPIDLTVRTSRLSVLDRRYTHPDGAYGHDLMAVGQTQLVSQVTASAGVDTQAVGIMAFDAALAAIVVAVRGNAYLWVLALVLFLYSVGWAVQPLFIDQPEAGQSLSESLAERGSFTDGELRDALFSSVVAASLENRQILFAKTTCVWRAIRWSALAVAVAAVGRMF
jgi:hypothetical protein